MKSWQKLIELDKWVLEGKELGNHVLIFKGADGLCEQRAKEFMQLQRTTTREWRKRYAVDENEQQVEVFVDGDKNRSMVRLEIITKKLAGLVAARTSAWQS